LSTKPAGAFGPVSRGQFLRLFSAVMLPMFLASVDQTLLSTATPAIVGDLGGLRQSFWIMTGYLVTATVVGPVYGRLGDRFGQREVLRYALCIFMCGAFVAGFAPNLWTLIGARVLQALGGGGLMVMAQALIGELIAPRERARYQVYFASIFTLSSVSGPVLGGLIVSAVGWRWLFWTVLPLAAIALWRVSALPKRAHRGHAAVFSDLPGLLLFAVAAVISLLWLSLAGHRFPWASPESVFAIAIAASLWFFLVRRERRHPRPFLPVELLRVHGIPTTTITSVLSSACLFSITFYLPMYLQLGLGASPAQAGLALVPVTFGLPIGGMIVGRIVSTTGQSKRSPAIGLTVTAGGLVALGQVPETLQAVLAIGLICGIGMGTVMPTTQLTLQSLAGRERLGVAASLASFARTSGGAAGTAATGALLFALMHGVDLRSLTSIAEQDRVAIIDAFRYTFHAIAMIAVAGAWVASRVPVVRF